MIKPSDSETTSRRRRLRRRLAELPVLPTLLTSGNLACGITAIFCAASANENANEYLFYGGVLIFVAMFCDMFDGKVARMTGTEGEFGAELDSLADVVSFGIAPAMLVHRLVLGDNPQRIWGEGERWIWLIVILYGVLTAIRLARYNVEHNSTEETKTFRGLPSPGAAAFLSSWVLFHAHFFKPAVQEDPSQATLLISLVGVDNWQLCLNYFLMVSTVCMAFLMVSRVRFPHFGNTLLGGRIGFSKLILLVLILGFVITQPYYGLIIGTTGYALVGVIPGAILAVKRWSQGRDILEDDEDDEDDVSAVEPTPTEGSATLRHRS